MAKYFASVTNLDALLSGLTYAKDNDLPLLLLGGGSNTIFTGDWDGLVLNIEIGGIQKIHEDAENYYIFAGAGVHWHSFVAYALSEQWFGLENLALIPGTVGAAPIQNIGAYGVELKDFVSDVHVINLKTHAIEKLSCEDCKFGYRDSIFKQAAKGQYVIIGVTFSLPKTWKPQVDYSAIEEAIGDNETTPQAVFEAVVKIRQSKLPDPSTIGNAGSFFKNVVTSAEIAKPLLEKYPDMPHFWVDNKTNCKIPSGWLIDQAGLKGYRNEDVGTYDKQALVLVNHGNGTAEQLEALIEHIQEEVDQTFGLELEIEPVLI
jgi:UDP-N-acetylmuramate dehydrogenase